jgi:DNA-binding transcriptional MerR regulator
MGIAELAQRAGVTPRTIRYYVAEGLLPPPGGRGQRRAYGQQHLDRLDAIRQLKAAYLPLHEIRRRLNASPASPSARMAAARAVGSSAQGVVPGPALAESTPPGTVAAVASRPPIGFGGTSGVGRIEIYDPPETVWRRHTLAPGVELHYRETEDPRLAEAIRRLIREAAAILDGRTHAPGEGQTTPGAGRAGQDEPKS